MAGPMFPQLREIIFTEVEDSLIWILKVTVTDGVLILINNGTDMVLLNPDQQSHGRDGDMIVILFGNYRTGTIYWFR